MRAGEERLCADGARRTVGVQAGLPCERGTHGARCVHDRVLGHVPVGEDRLSGGSRELPGRVQAPGASRTAVSAEQLPRHLRPGPRYLYEGSGGTAEELRGGLRRAVGARGVSHHVRGSGQAAGRVLPVRLRRMPGRVFRFAQRRVRRVVVHGSPGRGARPPVPAIEAEVPGPRPARDRPFLD